MTAKPRKKPHGQIRQGQLITTYGPGAMIDLPDDAVLVAGLEFWSGGGAPIVENRLADAARNYLELERVEFRAPPPTDSDPRAKPTGIRVWKFPEWFVTKKPTSTEAGPRRRRLVNRKSIVSNRFDDGQTKHEVVPVRFVRSCSKGHLDDIAWYAFVHEERGDCRKPLWMEETGPSGDLADTWIVCDCGARRSMVRAAKTQERALGWCLGRQPWLGLGRDRMIVHEEGGCQEHARLLVRHASNAYLPIKLGVISIPDADADLRDRVDRAWEDLQFANTLEMLRHERAKPRIARALGDLGDDRVFAEIMRRLMGGGVERRAVKTVELETLLSSAESVGDDRPEGKYFARSLSLRAGRTGPSSFVNEVVLVHRLREVVAQLGFTRFESVVAEIDGDLRFRATRAPLTNGEPTWLPAIENRGEGVFLSLARAEVSRWLARDAVKARGEKLRRGYDSARRVNKSLPPEFPGLPYLLLHSLSHLLLTAVALECGYPASSIRERVYADDELGYGILLYTASSDAAGTLGGLVESGRDWEKHLENALELGRLCSNDPVCAQHPPDHHYEERGLHGAACHGCLLIAEPSCERRNEFLDRALVTRTVDGCDAEFFRDSAP